MTEATRSGLFGLFFLGVSQLSRKFRLKVGPNGKKTAEIEIKRSGKLTDHTLKSDNLQYNTLGRCTAIPYRVSTGPEQGQYTGKPLFSIQ